MPVCKREELAPPARAPQPRCPRSGGIRRLQQAPALPAHQRHRGRRPPTGLAPATGHWQGRQNRFWSLRCVMAGRCRLWLGSSCLRGVREHNTDAQARRQSLVTRVLRIQACNMSPNRHASPGRAGSYRLTPVGRHRVCGTLRLSQPRTVAPSGRCGSPPTPAELWVCVRSLKLPAPAAHAAHYNSANTAFESKDDVRLHGMCISVEFGIRNAFSKAPGFSKLKRGICFGGSPDRKNES